MCCTWNRNLQYRKPDWDGAPTLSSCPINFLEQPQVDGTIGTTTNVKMKSSHAGTVYWVAYDNANNAPADLDALESALSANSGVDNSGSTGESVGANSDKTVVVENLVSGNTYYFYAGLKKSDGSESDISDVVTITVP